MVSYGIQRDKWPATWENYADHFTVLADLDIDILPQRTEKKTIKYRNIKAINIDSFKDDIHGSELLQNPRGGATELANQYDTVLRSLLDHHAPLLTKTISPKPPNPWMTPEIQTVKRQRRYLKRVWRRNPTPLNRTRLARQTHLCNRMMSKAKVAHYSELISENSSDQRSLWKTFNKILHRGPKMHLPEFSSIHALAETFGTFFVDKISIIRSAFPTGGHRDNANCDHPHDRKELQGFAPATEDEIRRLVMSAPCKSSDLDPIPTVLLKSCMDILVTPVTSIVNLSLSDGCFPTSFKNAHVSPLLKKKTLQRTKWKTTDLSPISALFPKSWKKWSPNVWSPTFRSPKLQTLFSPHTGNFIQLKLLSWKSTVIFWHRWTKVGWLHSLCWICQLPSIPLIMPSC